MAFAFGIDPRQQRYLTQDHCRVDKPVAVDLNADTIHLALAVEAGEYGLSLINKTRTAGNSRLPRTI